LGAIFKQFRGQFLGGVHTSKIIVICGPTGSGKSGLALQLAQRLQTVILSADSRACYREFNIGTAKPTHLEQRLVPHYLIDICHPTDAITVADYQAQAQALIAQFHQQSLTPLLVGGTGLYIRAITRGLKIPRVAPQPNLRSQLAQLDSIQRYEFLTQVDPQSAQRIHPHDQVRTLRALEVYYVTGRSLSEQQGEYPPHYPILQIGLDCTQPDGLTQRIQQRTRTMFAAGFVEEVATLIAKYGPALPLLETLGYQEVKSYLAGQITLMEAEDLIILHTRQFAKRQRTWFRSIPEIAWVDADHPQLFDAVWLNVQRFLEVTDRASAPPTYRVNA
jgi:tRNA dimethylallyltransferase